MIAISLLRAYLYDLWAGAPLRYRIGCASSTNAIVGAFNLIRLGKANVIITGGAEATVTPAAVGGFNDDGHLRAQRFTETASRPLARARRFRYRRRCTALILEELEHAARGATIYAEVAVVACQPMHTISPPHTLKDWVPSWSCETPWRMPRMQPEEIDYINVHGTSTPVGDISEAKAILDVFGDYGYK